MGKRRRKKRWTPGGVLLLVGGLLCLGIILLFARLVQWELTREMQVVQTNEQFYENLAPLAKKTGKKHDLYPSVILAQAAIESGFAQSELAVEYNNYFGIKAVGSDESVVLPTTEIEDGVSKNQLAGFRSYATVEESFIDYGKLIGKAPRYERVREANSPEEAANALHPCGYSTNPRYGELLIQIIERDHLKEYDE